jgi:hypothetical protein
MSDSGEKNVRVDQTEVNGCIYIKIKNMNSYEKQPVASFHRTYSYKSLSSSFYLFLRTTFVLILCTMFNTGSCFV